MWREPLTEAVLVDRVRDVVDDEVPHVTSGVIHVIIALGSTRIVQVNVSLLLDRGKKKKKKKKTCKRKKKKKIFLNLILFYLTLR